MQIRKYPYFTAMNGLTVACRNVYGFFRDGFREMTVGRSLWAVALVKLFIMFGILKLFFFPNFLNKNFDTDHERGDYVVNELIVRGK